MKQLFLKILIGFFALLISGGITMLWMTYMAELLTSDRIKYGVGGAFHFVGMLVIYHYLQRMIFNTPSKTS